MLFMYHLDKSVQGKLGTYTPNKSDTIAATGAPNGFPLPRARLQSIIALKYPIKPKTFSCIIKLD